SPELPAIVETLRAEPPDVLLSVWYRRLLGPDLLALPRIAALNLHGSLLPAYRGRAPVNWVLVNGERQTGVTLHHMTAEADAGDGASRLFLWSGGAVPRVGRGAPPGTLLEILPGRGIEVATGEGTLRLTHVQSADAAEQPADAWALGRGLRPGVRLTKERV